MMTPPVAVTTPRQRVRLRWRTRTRTRSIAFAVVGLSLLAIITAAGVVAQEMLATPIPDFVLPAENLASESTLQLTISTDTVAIGEIVQGAEKLIEDAVVVEVSGASGSWQLRCSAAPTSSHTTSATVDTLSFAPADTNAWVSFQTTPTECTSAVNGNASIGFDYLLAIPPTASPGTFDLVVTYSVETVD